jgi:Uncharacterized protein conserved in bacteria (DUF2272)
MSFEDLVSGHYGVAPRGLLPGAIQSAKLLAGYGKPLRPRKPPACKPAPAALSLSYDTGEVLNQSACPPQFEEYVVQQSTPEAAFEEYVVWNIEASPSPQAVAASFSTQSGAEVSPADECQVDILQQFNPSQTSRPRSAANDYAPAYAANDDRARRVPSQNAPYAAYGEKASAQSTEDDFVKDMEAIFSGKKVYDPVSKKTVAPNELSNAASTSPKATNDRPAPEPKNEQAIFDRIAQSMEYANKFDLGTVELENRFSDFDRIAELRQKAEQEAKESKRQESSSSQTPSSNGTVSPKVDSTDFLQDLEAIKQQQSSSSTPALAPSPTAPVITPPANGAAVVTQPGAAAVSSSSQPPAAAQTLSQPIQTVCGFFGNTQVLTEQQVRDALRLVMEEEHRDWLDATGNLKFEGNDTQFGQLVFYALGAKSDIRPTTLTHAQAAAISGGVNFGQLLNTNPALAVGADITRVRNALLRGAPNPRTPRNLDDLVDDALQNARSSKLDRFAWSAVFISTCVRRVAIQLGIEAEVSGSHVGKDELLEGTTAHRVYVVEAHNRRFGTPRKDGAFHAFRISERLPQIGDIIIQDRQATSIGNVVQFDQIPTVLPKGRELHGDIVIEVAADNVVTVGGNLGPNNTGSVRRRRYPLDTTGHLTVQANQLYEQEGDNGTLANISAPTTAAGFDLHSTGRIFALLSLVQVCAAIPGQPMNGGILV